MTLLQFFFIVSGVIILITGIDVAKKEKFNALHFLIFLGVGIGLLTFSFSPKILELVGGIFGVARGADALVYISIIFLLYFVLLLLKKVEYNRENITKIVRELAIERSKKKIISGEEVILIRAYNEGQVIIKVIDEILINGYKNILVINDGSTDNTKEILKTYKDKINLVNHFTNRGAGAALETGFEYLRRFGNIKHIITFDADGQHNLKDVSKILEIMKRNKDNSVIFGSRFIGNGDSNIPFFRKIILYLGKVFTFFISGVLLTDSHNGLRCFKLNVIKNIKLNIDGMAYASELVDELNKNKIKIKEVPVTIKYTDYSLKKGQKSTNAINIAFRFLWEKFFK